MIAVPVVVVTMTGKKLINLLFVYTNTNNKYNIIIIIIMDSILSFYSEYIDNSKYVYYKDDGNVIILEKQMMI
jgi:hypothetical protein